MQNKIPRGQVGLLLLVIVGVVVALVMSVASRSLSDTVLSRQERESSAAFSVAETGVENALSALQNPDQGQQIGGSLTDVAGFVTGNYKVDNLSTYSLYLREGETAHLDLTGLTGPVTIYWTRKDDASEDIKTCNEGSGGAPASIEVIALQGSSSAVTRGYYNASNCGSLASSNRFDTSADGGAEYRSSIQLTQPTDIPAGTTALRIKPIYTGATVAASGSGLDTQLYKIQSKAAGGDAQKEIEVKRGLDAPPSIFDYAVFTAGSIVK
jgi:hypothetical protein